MYYSNKKRKKSRSMAYAGSSFAASAVGLSVGSHVVGSVSAGTAVAGTANSGLVALSSYQAPMASVVGGGMALNHLNKMVKKKKRRY